MLYAAWRRGKTTITRMKVRMKVIMRIIMKITIIGVMKEIVKVKVAEGVDAEPIVSAEVSAL
jgi:hypothetical protein